ncbi:MAG: AAA family ATPase, partial [Silicimonas sp.]|nr:AAA family ATPase [Silicimonas sp.]
DLYMEYFGFSERPFTLLPDPDFLFWSRAHRRAFSVLEYGVITRAPITIVTGEVGVGKTTLIQKLLQTLESDVTLGLISNAQGGRGELLQWVLNSLGVETDLSAAYVTLFQQLQDFVIEEYASGRRVILLIDEAQNLSAEGLEELRMLTNINSNKDELLQLILVGQPELRQMIMRPELRQFAQRVTATYHIGSLDRAGVAGYIQHRLSHVGGAGTEFTAEAIDLVHSHTHGIPRLVNKLCDFSMVYAATEERRVVDAAIIEEVLDDGIFLPALTITGEAAE